ncbi:MAG: aminoacyl-tRNA hydrolase [Oscillospiraceae bacterium]|nr:aminoacyl-tRNA hydrolase [Oscillospiraceae bacterium]
MFFKSRNKNNINNIKKNSGKIKYIIAGLGNPGEKYLFTRHNAGFLALDYISQKYNLKINNVKFKSLCAKYTVSLSQAENGTADNIFDVLFMKPQTYMNNSGVAISEAMRFYKIPPENILVISDDVNLAVGKLRIKKSGSDGGQKGLRSITDHLSSEDFPRIKIGVGEKPHPDYELADWVLSKFSKDDEKIMFGIFDKVHDCVDMFIKQMPIDKIQNKYN